MTRKPPLKANDFLYRDHLGNVYTSISMMCEQYGISPQVFLSRMHKCHWDVREALTVPPKAPPQSVTDPWTGKSYPTRKALAEAYRLNPSTLGHRLYRGWTLSRALKPNCKSRPKFIVPESHQIKPAVSDDPASVSERVRQKSIAARLAAEAQRWRLRERLNPYPD